MMKRQFNPSRITAQMRQLLNNSRVAFPVRFASGSHLFERDSKSINFQPNFSQKRLFSVDVTCKQQQQQVNTNDLIVNITRENYNQELSNNKQILIIDFYADWCDPCRQFTPILEKLVKQRNGTFKLLKVNADEQQEISSAFKVTALPTLYVVWKKQAITQKIEGGMTEEQASQFLDQIEQSLSAELENQPTEQEVADETDGSQQGPRTPQQKLDIAKQLMAMDHIPKAEALLSQILTEDAPKMDKTEKNQIVPNVYATFAMCYLLVGDMNQAGEIISRINTEYPDAAEKVLEVRSTISLYEIYNKAGEEIRGLAASLLRDHIEEGLERGQQFDYDRLPFVAQLKQRIEQDAKDYEAYYNLSLFYSLNGMYKEALDQAMNIAKRNIKWNDYAAKKLILNYTDIMPDRKEADAARRKLSMYLYV